MRKVCTRVCATLRVNHPIPPLLCWDFIQSVEVSLTPTLIDVSDPGLQIITAISEGKDLSALIPQVMNNMQTTILELKKLVYLYMINYAAEDPEVVVMSVNSFVKDATDPNPIIRALAIRTMGCVRVNKISEYLADPLLLCLDDKDPYVRKTASLCVAKLYAINPVLVIERGFVDSLHAHLRDDNPMVVSNALAGLAEMDDRTAAVQGGAKPPSFLKVDAGLILKWLVGFNDFSEVRCAHHCLSSPYSPLVKYTLCLDPGESRIVSPTLTAPVLHCGPDGRTADSL